MTTDPSPRDLIEFVKSVFESKPQQEHIAYVSSKGIKPARLVKKIPMRQMVIDENNDIWAYFIDEKSRKVDYVYLYSATYET